MTAWDDFIDSCKRHEVLVEKVGYTGSVVAMMDHVIRYRTEMVADGWSISPISPHESQNQYARLKRDGFVCHISAREHEKKAYRGYGASLNQSHYVVALNMWGPDGLVVISPYPYSFEQLILNLNRCNKCKRPDIEPQRVGFAGRVCPTCLPSERAIIETPGWSD